MKCHEAQHWLLAARQNEALPCALRKHLMECVDCRMDQQALGRLDEQVKQMPLPPASAAAKAGLWQRLDATSAHSLASLPPLPVPALRATLPVTLWRPRRWHVAAVAVAATMLFALGLWFGRHTSRSPAELAAGPKNGLPARGYASGLLVRVAKHDVQLSAAADDQQRLDSLRLLATDLKDEALRLAKDGALDDVPLLAALYDQVARQGVVRRALLMPAEKRPAAAAQLIEQFQATGAQVEAFAKTALPVAAKMVRPIALAAGESAGMLTAAEPPAPPALGPLPASATNAPLAALVHLTLKLADEADPLRRADLSSELASVLAQTTVVLSAAGAAQQADQLGVCLGDLLEHGVAGNLSKVPFKDDTALQAEVNKVWTNSAQVFVVLETNLAQAPPLAQEGLKKALQSSSHGRDTVLKQGKGAVSLPDDPKPGKNGAGKGKPKTGTEEVKGVLKSVDPIQQSLTITIKKKGKVEDHTYGLPKYTPVIGGAPGKAGSLLPGVEVILTLAEDRITVLEIRVAGKK